MVVNGFFHSGNDIWFHFLREIYMQVIVASHPIRFLKKQTYTITQEVRSSNVSETWYSIKLRES